VQEEKAALGSAVPLIDEAELHRKAVGCVLRIACPAHRKHR
jgi:hypothetical protein